MAVTVKIPTQLRGVTEGESEIEVDGGDRRRGARRRLRPARRASRADHRGRRAAQVRERLRLGRGHPLPGRAGDGALRRRRGDDPARRRRRLEPRLAPARSASGNPIPSPAVEGIGPVVILCGGRGTRLQERTHAIPKALVEIGDRPILWHVIRIYAAQGLRRFLLLTGYLGEMIEEFVIGDGVAGAGRDRVRRHRARHPNGGTDRAGARAPRRAGVLRHLRRRGGRPGPRGAGRLSPRPRRAWAR